MGEQGDVGLSHDPGARDHWDANIAPLGLEARLVPDLVCTEHMPFRQIIRIAQCSCSRHLRPSPPRARNIQASSRDFDGDAD
eukprot:3127165-Pleurochrysis_carterae.AAC.1